MKKVNKACGRDFMTLLNDFLDGKNVSYQFFHCPLHPEHDLSMKLENYYYYCYKCGKHGTYAALKSHCMTVLKHPLSDFAPGTFDKSWFSCRDMRAICGTQKRMKVANPNDYEF